MDESSQMLRARNIPGAQKNEVVRQARAPVGNEHQATRQAQTRGWVSVVLDVARVLGGVLLLSGTLSYLVTGNKSLTWNYNVNPARLKTWIVSPGEFFFLGVSCSPLPPGFLSSACFFNIFSLQLFSLTALTHSLA